MLRNSLAHVARGADAVMFFQWRQSVAGAEKFHSAMVPHGGRDTRVWREVAALGEALKRLGPVKGSTVESRVAIVFDYEAWWASELDSHPSEDVKYLDLLRAFHRSLFLRGVGVDFVHPAADLAGYDLVLVCTLYCVTDDAAANIAGAAEAGATVLVSYFSGIVDERDHIRLGGYPGAFRKLLGIRTEEFHPLLEGGQVTLSDGTNGRIWSEHVHLAGAEAVATFTDYPLEGVPALTRRTAGRGAAWYLATLPDRDGIERLLDRLLAEAGVAASAEAAAGVELTRRVTADGRRFLFAINHGREDVAVKADGEELLGGGRFGGLVPGGAVAVIAED
jgi:beta-galactosidase